MDSRTAELKSINEQLRLEITERRHAEQALRESEQRYRLLTQNSLTGIFIHQDGIFTYVNERLADMGGYAPEEMLGRPFWEFIHPDDRARISEIGGSGTSEKRVAPQYEFRYRCKNGETRWAELLAARVEYLGRPAIMGNVADIADRKLAEQALRRSEEQYRLLVDNANEGILVAQDGRIQFVNPRMIEITGYPKEELLSRPFVELIHPDHRRMVTVKHEKTLRNEARPHTYGFKALDSDGNTKWVEISAVLIEWQARPATLNFIEDITGKRRMEEELVRMERFESIGILAGGIAHDFNNILTAILGNISLAKMHLSPSDKVFQKLTEAEKASVAAQSLTQQLLTFARGGALMKRLSHIPQVVESACRFALTGANVRCHFRWPPDLWTVEVDEGQISHVINNLIINAAQAMPQGGLVTVSAENAFLHAQSGLPLVQGKYVKLSIEDHGTGIPQDLLSRVFDPYFTTKQTGTGLGLTMCYSVTKNHGGLITVDSEVGVGTTFQIYLPASEREADTVQESEARIHGLL